MMADPTPDGRGSLERALARYGLAVVAVAVLSACSNEARQLGPSVPQTRPLSEQDGRIPAYQDNVYQIAQGGRYFAWYGCSGCHAEASAGVRHLADDRWAHGGGFAQVFASIADRHGRLAYGRRMPVEQIWQVTAYVRDLPRHTPEKRRRNAIDQSAEPQGADWTGPQ